MADLVTRLKLDDKEFNNNIRRSKKQLSDFEKAAEKVGKTISKAFIALEAAKAVIDTFSFGIESSSEAARAFDTTIDAAKTTVSNFFSSLISGNWKPFQNGIKESISLAKQFADAMYEQGKVNEYGTFYADYLEGQRNNLEYIITSDNSTNEEKKAAQSQYAELSNEEIKERQNIINKSYNALNKGLQSKGITTEYSLDELLRLASLVQNATVQLTDEQKAFKDLLNSTDLKPIFQTIAENTDKIGTIKKDLDDSVTDVGKVEPEEQTINPLDLLAWDVEGWINEEIKGLHNPLRKAIENGEKVPIKELPIEIEENVFEDALPEGVVDFGLTLADSMQLAGQAMYGLGGAFQAFSQNAAVGKAGLILGAIGQLVMGYATATAQAAKLGPWAWIGFAATGLGVLATTISQIKGFADGGIVNSPYTVGDRNLIRVNGGEMILTRGQQANLFNLLENGVSGSRGGNVTFTIKGKELVGVLNNYNNMKSKVL